MLEMPDNIVEFFFCEIRKKGKFDVVIEDNRALIKPREEQQYFKPSIIVKDLSELEQSLIHFVECLNEFYAKNNILQSYHDLSFFFNNLFFNMTSNDALDLVKYINERSYYFSNEHFKEFDTPQLLTIVDNVSFYVQRYLETPGLETPFILAFSMIVDGKYYNLPLVRYTFDENNVCHLFAIQYGRNREVSSDINFQKIVKQVNTGVSKCRNVSPSFVLTFALFLKVLDNYEVNKLLVPDFLFARYRNYYRASSEIRSDLILERILNNFIRLLQRMEVQVNGFEIENYPNEIDSYTHINLSHPNVNKGLLQRILNKSTNS
ncbi:MAG: hypothetical protein E7161_01680 [Firmicutes bacterium]|nr:hypothetical protein [Bacillota bacterium]